MSLNLLKMLPKQYQSVIAQFRKYWFIYGGFTEFVRSPFVHLAIALTLLLHKLWLSHPSWDLVLSIIPSVLGFSLGGYAILLALGDETFRRAISGKNESADGHTELASPFMILNAAFLHFILFQIFALLLAIIAKGNEQALAVTYSFELGEIQKDATGLSIALAQVLARFLGFWIFIYALLLSIAATMAIFRAADWFDRLTALVDQQASNATANNKDETTNTS